jgi:hypothetical protein
MMQKGITEVLKISKAQSRGGREQGPSKQAKPLFLVSLSCGVKSLT